MKKVFRQTNDIITVAVRGTPITDYQQGIMFKFGANNRPYEMLMRRPHLDQLPLIMDTIAAFSKAEDLASFEHQLVELGYSSQANERFWKQWELERTIKRAAELQQELAEV